jgi:coenzyme F420-reducing hydrogenase alpha subunit
MMPKASIIRVKGMEGKSNKLGIIGEIYTRLSKENKEKLIRTAASLLKVQKEDTKMLTDISSSQNKGKKEKLV